MICLKCNTFHFGFAGRLCPVCSEPLQTETTNNRDKLVLGRLNKYLMQWQKSGQVSKQTVNEIEAAIAKTVADSNYKDETHSLGFLNVIWDWIQTLFTSFIISLGAVFEPIIVQPNSKRSKQKHSRKESDASYESLTEGILSEDNSRLSGLDSVVGLDDIPIHKIRKNKHNNNQILSPEPEFVIWAGIRPLFNEYIWWFIGSLLVLTGSIMGIREAWLVLTGISRHITVLSAIFLYQVLFLALGIFLGTKSILTGRLLSGISLLLLPVSFSVVSDVIISNSMIGFISLAILIGLNYIFLRFISNQFQLHSNQILIPILPSMVFLALIPFFGLGLPSILLCFLPLVSIQQMGKKLLENKVGSMGLFLLSIYGGLSVLAVYLNLPAESGERFVLGSLSLVVLFLWVLLLSAILAIGFGMYAFRNEVRRVYLIMELFFLAVTLVIASISGIFIYTTPVNEFGLNLIRSLYILIPCLVSLLFFDTISRHEMSINPFMVLSIFSSFLIMREIFPNTDWAISFISFVPVTGMIYSKHQSDRMKNILYFWGIGIGIICCILLILANSTNPNISPEKWSLFFERIIIVSPILFCGIYFGLTTHWVSGFSRSILHIAGAVGIFTFIYACILIFLPLLDFYTKFGISFGLLSALYHFGAKKFERLAPIEKEKVDSSFAPMDDISFIAGIFSFLNILFISNLGSTTLEYILIILIGAILIIRSFRDNSSLSGFLGSIIIGLTILRFSLDYFSQSETAGSAFISSSIALGFGVLCILFPNLNPVEVKSRKVFFVIRLPFAAQGPVLIRNGLSATSLIYVIYSIFLFFVWLGLIGQPDRIFVIYSGIILTFVFIIAFFTRGYNSFYLRGSTVSFALIFISIGFAAVANRIGRPLPPTVVGINLTFGIIGLWFFSRLLFHKGQVLANWLDNPIHGKIYHFVPLYTMLLLGIVLILDVFLLQPFPIERFLYVTPPTFFLGAGIAAFLFGRSIVNLIPLQIALGLFVFASILGFSQENLFGIDLVALDLPGSRWVPSVTQEASRFADWLDPNIFLPPNLNLSILILRSAFGIAVIGILYALFVLVIPIAAIGLAVRKIIFHLEELLPLQFTFSNWSIICTFLLTLIAFQYAFIIPGIISLVAGVVLLLSRFSKAGNVSVALSGILILHGLAHQNLFYPLWVGPTFAGIAFIMILSVKPVSMFSTKPYGRILESSHLGAFLYSSIGILYALATLSVSVWDNAVPGLLTGVWSGFSGLWMQTLALGVTSGIIALSLSIGALQWTKSPTILAAIGSMFSFAFSGITAFPVLCQYGICTSETSIRLLSEMIPYFALIVSIIATCSYFLSQSILQKREDYSIGVGFASDTLIVLTGILLGIFIRLSVISNLLWSNIVILISIGLVILISLIASFRAKQGRHLYFAQTSIASLYLALKDYFPEILTPEVDAIAALLFGFILTGITSIARRVGIPPLEESTRRFAALMPVVVVLVVPTEVSYQNAGMATFSAALYAALAITSSNRIYAVLAAVAANLAIFTAIMASEVQGFEIYLAPLGLFFLFLGHIFRENLTEQARKIIRVGGGLLLYLPASVNISFEMGRAANPMYAVLFGFLCLFGVLAGMIFQIRSYLFMGVSFFTLNLVANLLQSGLRDQRTGFILLSLTGLAIIGSLVAYTLKKEQILSFIGQIQNRLAKWD